MVEKTGDERMDYLIDKKADKIRELEQYAQDRFDEIAELIKRIHEIRAKRLGRQNG